MSGYINNTELNYLCQFYNKLYIYFMIQEKLIKAAFTFELKFILAFGHSTLINVPAESACK